MEKKRIIRIMLDYVPTEHLRDVRAKLFSSDGGPGSGNFGHAGRPGKVGGSMPGGGRQYRGGRADIGYFNSKKDWLNGLSGEKQQKASRFLSAMRKNIPPTVEVAPEEAIMKYGGRKNKKELLDYVGEARSWDKTGHRLQKNNLTEEEVLCLTSLAWDHTKELSAEEFLNNNLDSVFDSLSPEEQEFYLDMKAKACGLPTSGKRIEDYSDEFQIKVGAKEPPKEKEKEKDYSFFDTDKGWLAGKAYGYMSAVIEGGYYGRTTSKEKKIELMDNFLDALKHERLYKRQTYNALQALAGIRHMCAQSNQGKNEYERYEYKPDTFSSLSSEEKARLLEIVNRYGGKNVTDVSQLTVDDIDDTEWGLKRIGTKKEDITAARDYVLLSVKALTGIEPKSDEEYNQGKEEEKRKKEEEEKAKKEEGENKRKAIANSPEAQARRENAKKLREARENGEAIVDTSCRFSQQYGEEGYKTVARIVNESKSVDAQVLWDLYGTSATVKGPHPVAGQCCENDGSIVYLDYQKNITGNQISAPFQTVFHEVAHSADAKAARKLGYGDTHLSVAWRNGAFADTIEEEAQAYLDRVKAKAKQEFEEIEEGGSGYEMSAKFTMPFSKRYDEVRWHGKTIKFDIAALRAYYYNMPRDATEMRQIGAIADAVQGATGSKTYCKVGHNLSYYQGPNRRENMATEMFANLYGSMMTNPAEYERTKREFPKTVALFEEMLKEISEEG